MERQKIKDIVKEFLIDEFEVEEGQIQDENPLVESLDLDSLDYVDMVVVIEDNFGFKVDPQEFKELKTFNQFYDYIEQKVNA